MLKIKIKIDQSYRGGVDRDGGASQIPPGAWADQGSIWRENQRNLRHFYS